MDPRHPHYVPWDISTYDLDDWSETSSDYWTAGESDAVDSNSDDDRSYCSTRSSVYRGEPQGLSTILSDEIIVKFIWPIILKDGYPVRNGTLSSLRLTSKAWKQLVDFDEELSDMREHITNQWLGLMDLEEYEREEYLRRGVEEWTESDWMYDSDREPKGW